MTVETTGTLENETVANVTAKLLGYDVITVGMRVMLSNSNVVPFTSIGEGTDLGIVRSFGKTDGFSTLVYTSYEESWWADNWRVIR